MTATTDVLYRLLVQGVTDYAIFMLDPDGIVVNWNDGPADQAIRCRRDRGPALLLLLHGSEDRAAGVPEAGLRQARETGRFEAEGWRYRRDGTAFWALVVIDAIRDEDGHLLGFAKITRDRTEKRAQELQILKAKELAERHRDELAATTDFLDSVVATMPSSVIVQDATTGLIRLANRQARRCSAAAPARSSAGRRRRPADRRRDAAEARPRDDRQSIAVHDRPRGAVATACGPRTLRMRALAIAGRGEQPVHGLLIAEDVSEAHAANVRIHHLAHYDMLTGLPTASCSGSGSARPWPRPPGRRARRRPARRCCASTSTA